MKIKTSEAIKMANEGKSLENIVLEDINDVQINVRDAMTLSRQGIVVPEANLFYKDDDIVYDEEIDGLERIGEFKKMSWKEKEDFFSDEIEDDTFGEISIKIKMPNNSVKEWLEKNSKRISAVLEPIILNLYKAEEKIKNTFTQHNSQNKSS